MSQLFLDLNISSKIGRVFQTFVALSEAYVLINLRYFSISKFVKVKNAISHNFLWRLKPNKWTFCPRRDGICCMGCSIILGGKNNLSECLIVKSFIDWYMFAQPPAEKKEENYMLFKRQFDILLSIHTTTWHVFAMSLF